MGLLEIFKKGNRNEEKTIKYDLSFDNYRKAVFLWSQNKKELKDNKDYPVYFESELHIKKPLNFHLQLIKNGYLEKSDNDKYVLTEYGKQYLEVYDELVQLHRHKDWEINLFEYIKAKTALSFESKFGDVVWSIFQERKLQYINSKFYGFLRNNYLHMFQLLKEEKKKSQSLICLLCVFALDMNLYENQMDIFLEQGYIPSPMFAPAIITQIVKHKDYYSDEIAEKAYQEIPLPLFSCPIELFKELIQDIFNNELNEDIYRQKIEKNFKSKYKKYIK